MWQVGILCRWAFSVQQAPNCPAVLQLFLEMPTMTRNRVLALFAIAGLLFLGALGYQNHAASQTKAAADKDTLADQVKELKNQVN
jgi:hypothetical protein